MPPIVAAIAAVVVTIGAETALVTVIGIGGLQLLGTVIGSVVVYGALSIGSSYLARSLMPKPKTPDGSTPSPAPSDGQQTTRTAVSSRWKHYGRVMIGGAVAFYESKDGMFYVLMLQGQGPHTQIRKHLLNDLEVTVDAHGWVTSTKYVLSGSSKVRIQNTLGTVDQLSFQSLMDAFPGIWTEAHQARGVACALLMYNTVPAANFADVYRGGAPTYRCVVDASQYWDPRTDTTAWGDNSALVVLDFLISADGMRMGLAEIDLVSFEDAADVCDEQMDLSGSAVEKRYRTWGGYQLSEEPVQVLERMLAPCGGQLYETPEGKVAIRVAKWREPEVTIDANVGHVISYQLRRGLDEFTKANVIKGVFTYPDNDYKETDADPWRDEASIVRYGQLEDRLELYMCPSHTQTRRLAKLHCAQLNPLWVGSIVTNLYGLTLLGERELLLNLPELGIEFEPFTITGFSVNDDGASCTVAISHASRDAYAFSIAEEGTLPKIPAETGSDDGKLPLPSGLRVVVGKVAAHLAFHLVWDMSAFDTTTYYRVMVYDALGAVFPQTNVAVDYGTSIAGINHYESYGELVEGATYTYTIQTFGTGGMTSNVSEPAEVIMTAVTGASPAPTDIEIRNGDAGELRVVWSIAASDNYIGVRVYSSGTNDVATASLVATLYGAPNTHENKRLPNTVTRTHYFWLASLTASMVESVKVGGVRAPT